MLGWSDGGITALIAAAKYPHLIRKMVVWGANAFVSEQDLQLYDGDCNQITWLTIRPRCVSPTRVTEHNLSPRASVDINSGPRRRQLEPEDEGTHGEDVWSGSLR